MAEYRVVEKDWLDQMANVIRSKTGSDELMPREAFIPAIEGISGGGVDIGIVTVDTDTREIAFPSEKTASSVMFMKIGDKVGFGYRAFLGWLHVPDMLDTDCIIYNNSSGSTVQSAFGNQYAEYDEALHKVTLRSSASSIGTIVAGEYVYVLF